MIGHAKTKLIMYCIDHGIDNDGFYKTMSLLPDVLNVNYGRVLADKEIEIGFYFKYLHHTLTMSSINGTLKRFEIDHITSNGIRCVTVGLNPSRLFEYITA